MSDKQTTQEDKEQVKSYDEIKKKIDAINRSLGEDGYDTNRLFAARNALLWACNDISEFWEDLV